MSLLSGVSLAWLSIVGYLVIAFCFAYAANGYRIAVINGENGINLGLMYLCGALANIFIYLAAASALVLFYDLYNYYLIAIWTWRLLSEGLVLISLLHLAKVGKRATNGQPSTKKHPG